jgi:aspartyl-tRNA(Asn)/glutamyl-tRNA(Gln) amidotransferase subunit C
MTPETFDHISELSRLTFADEQKADFIRQMDGIIALMDTIKDIDVTYDDTKDGGENILDRLRPDTAAPSFDTDRLLSNTNPKRNCYVIPKMMD